jgi:hypothetical protein
MSCMHIGNYLLELNNAVASKKLLTSRVWYVQHIFWSVM